MGIARLPRKVEYTERDGRTKVKGKVVKEAFFDEEYPFGDFHKLIQLLEINGKQVIRMGYYVKNNNAPKSKYTWGSQTTFMLRRENFEELLRRARAQGII